MQYNYLSPLAACLALTVASPAQAADVMPLQHSTFPQLQQQFHLNLSGQSNLMVKGDALQFVGQHLDKKHMNHIRMQQHYAGYLVVGGYAILHSKQSLNQLMAQGNNVTMNGKVYKGLDLELGQPSASLEQNKHEAVLQFKAQYAGSVMSEETVQPVVYIDAQNKAHWAYKVSVLITHTDNIPARPTAILDAVTYKPFIQWNDIKTAARKEVKGRGFGGNTKVGEVSYGQENLPFLTLTRAKGTCYMENTEVRVVDMNHGYFSLNRPMSFTCKKAIKGLKNTFWTGYDGNGYDKINGAFSPSNDALYAGYVIKHMYHDWYNIEALTKTNGEPMQLVMRVHYGDNYENAYWDGKQMTFGDGEYFLYPLVSLGVGSHEVSHGFTEQHSSLEYYGQSGGMNESFSDMAAQAAEYYSTGEASWMIGAEIIKERTGFKALRYMDKPSRDGRSIDSADDYYDSLDVHYSSGVYNHLFYILSNTKGWDARKAFDVMVKANMDYWTPYESFDEGGCGVMSATKDLGYSVDEVKASLDAVAIHYQSCE